MTATVSLHLGGDAVHRGAQRRSPLALIRGGTIVNHDSSWRADVLGSHIWTTHLSVDLKAGHIASCVR